MLPGDDPRPGRAGGAAARAAEAGGRDLARDGAVHRHGAGAAGGRGARRTSAAAAAGARRRSGPSAAASAARRRRKPMPPTTRTFPAGSYIVRMDQPYRRIADALLDYQYWAPNDPQRTPYDDTGWTFPELFDVQAVRVTDVEGARRRDGAGQGRRVAAPAASPGTAAVFAINHNADNALITLRYRLKDADIRGRRRAVRGRRREVRARLVHHQATCRRPTSTRRATELGLQGRTRSRPRRR